MIKQSSILKSFIGFVLSLFFALNSFAQTENIDAPILNSVLTGMDIEKIKGEINTVEISEYIAKDSSGVLKKVKPWLFDHIVRFNDKNIVYRIDYINRSCVNDISYKIDSSKFEYINIDSCSFTKKQVDREIWLYDKSGNIIEYNSSENGVVDNKKVAQYNDNKKITDYKVFARPGDLLRESSYKYDEKGKLIEYRQNYVSYEYLIKYVYNANNLIQEEQRLDEKGILERKTIYKYDSKLNLIEKSEFSGTALTEKETFQYDALGKRTASVTYNEKNIVLFKSTVKYDTKAVKTEETASNYSDNKIYQQLIKKFYPNGNVSESQRKEFNEQGQVTSTLLDKYDSAGNLIESINTDLSDPSNPLKKILKYEFDKRGNWTKKTETFTGEYDTFVVTERKINYR
jgi:hypothetical protein